MAWCHRYQIVGWISPWQMNDRGNTIQWFQKWSDLNCCTYNYGAHEGCHLWLPYEKELKVTSLIGWDIQQLDNSMFSRIDQHSTTTWATYIHMNQPATEYRTALYLHLCVQWTPNSIGVLYHLYSLIIYIHNHIMVFWVDKCQYRWMQVTQRNELFKVLS
jgi:hypothetical protein